ncbi:MYXO-CTERM sorting domain-containing protein [Myxococcota bacterium]|nr:MYXO-CTERM sorting domain-containing protein [Myxococcota bacterium]
MFISDNLSVRENSRIFFNSLSTVPSGIHNLGAISFDFTHYDNELGGILIENLTNRGVINFIGANSEALVRINSSTLSGQFSIGENIVLNLVDDQENQPKNLIVDARFSGDGGVLVSSSIQLNGSSDFDNEAIVFDCDSESNCRIGSNSTSGSVTLNLNNAFIYFREMSSLLDSQLDATLNYFEVDGDIIVNIPYQSSVEFNGVLNFANGAKLHNFSENFNLSGLNTLISGDNAGLINHNKLYFDHVENTHNLKWSIRNEDSGEIHIFSPSKINFINQIMIDNGAQWSGDLYIHQDEDLNLLSTIDIENFKGMNSFYVYDHSVLRFSGNSAEFNSISIENALVFFSAYRISNIGESYVENLTIDSEENIANFNSDSDFYIKSSFYLNSELFMDFSSLNPDAVIQNQSLVFEDGATVDINRPINLQSGLILGFAGAESIDSKVGFDINQYVLGNIDQDVPFDQIRTDEMTPRYINYGRTFAAVQSGFHFWTIENQNDFTFNLTPDIDNIIELNVIGVDTLEEYGVYHFINENQTLAENCQVNFKNAKFNGEIEAYNTKIKFYPFAENGNHFVLSGTLEIVDPVAIKHLSPRSIQDNMPGEIIVNGDLDIFEDYTLTIDAYSPNNNDTLVVTADLLFKGRLILNLQGDHHYQIGDQFIVARAGFIVLMPEANLEVNGPYRAALSLSDDASLLIVTITEVLDITPPRLMGVALEGIEGPMIVPNPERDHFEISLMFDEPVYLDEGVLRVTLGLSDGATLSASLSPSPATSLGGADSRPEPRALTLRYAADDPSWHHLEAQLLRLERVEVEGALIDEAGNALSGPLSLSDLEDVDLGDLRLDTRRPRIASVAPQAGGTLRLGDTLIIEIAFSEALYGGGDLACDLSAGVSLVTTIEPGAAVARFEYIVGPDDLSGPLRLEALRRAGGALTDEGGVNEPDLSLDGLGLSVDLRVEVDDPRLDGGVIAPDLGLDAGGDDPGYDGGVIGADTGVDPDSARTLLDARAPDMDPDDPRRASGYGADATSGTYDEEADGCGCAVGAESRGGGLFVALIGLVALFLRRRRAFF